MYLLSTTGRRSLSWAQLQADKDAVVGNPGNFCVVLHPLPNHFPCLFLDLSDVFFCKPLPSPHSLCLLRSCPLPLCGLKRRPQHLQLWWVHPWSLRGHKMHSCFPVFFSDAKEVQRNQLYPLTQEAPGPVINVRESFIITPKTPISCKIISLSFLLPQTSHRYHIHAIFSAVSIFPSSCQNHHESWFFHLLNVNFWTESF